MTTIDNFPSPKHWAQCQAKRVNLIIITRKILKLSSAKTNFLILFRNQREDWGYLPERTLEGRRRPQYIAKTSVTIKCWIESQSQKEPKGQVSKGIRYSWKAKYLWRTIRKEDKNVYAMKCKKIQAVPFSSTSSPTDFNFWKPWAKEWDLISTTVCWEDKLTP